MTSTKTRNRSPTYDLADATVAIRGFDPSVVSGHRGLYRFLRYLKTVRLPLSPFALMRKSGFEPEIFSAPSNEIL